MAGVSTRPKADTEQTVQDPEQIGELLDALEDVDCRAIIEATREETLSASEISEKCDLPLSTTYRKLEKLTDVGLLDEEIRLSRSGKHTSEYALSIENVQLSVDGENGVELVVSYRSGEENPTPMVAGAD
jgi:DNA-binding IclR family transcriptional regulator